MLSVVVYIAVVVAFWFLADLVTRDRTTPSAARARPRRRVRHALGRVWSLPRRLVGRLRAARRKAPAPDPFVALELQLRLAAVTSEIQRLEGERHAIAVAHHMRASQYAYDALLAQACRLAGLDDLARIDDAPQLVSGDDADEPVGSVLVRRTVDDERRIRQELELGARGWSW